MRSSHTHPDHTPHFTIGSHACPSAISGGSPELGDEVTETEDGTGAAESGTLDVDGVGGETVLGTGRVDGSGAGDSTACGRVHARGSAQASEARRIRTRTPGAYVVDRVWA